HSTRLTGLHFIRVKDYYQKMEPLIQSYLENPKQLYKEVKNLQYDEEFLYKLIKHGIGFGKIRNNHYRPPHGFHIGITRISNDKEIKSKIHRYLKQLQLNNLGIIE